MSQRNQVYLILLHIGLGVLIAKLPFFSKFYAILIFLAGLYVVVKNKNRNNEILYVIAYIAGSEVLLRTTNGGFFYEYGKYLMLFFTFLGFLLSGLPKIKNPYWFFLLLLLPSIFISFHFLENDYRRKISFEILGPICLGFLSVYNYNKSLSLKEIKIILSSIGFPLVTTCFYLIINYTYNLDKVNMYGSNFYYSGNFGPNQLATVLGFGFFIYFLKVTQAKKYSIVFYFYLLLFCLIFYRGLLTFSRGGIVTGIIAIFSFILIVHLSKVNTSRVKEYILIFILFLSVITIVDYQTKNCLSGRYTNITKFDFSEKKLKKGRYMLVSSDINNFIENPIFGVGVGVGQEIRKANYNKIINTHSEVTRLVSEHGLLGLTCFFILIIFPIINFKNNIGNIYLIPFFVFWFLSINHSATRIILPLFLYSLTVVKIYPSQEERN